jgi:hypothetical protein
VNCYLIRGLAALLLTAIAVCGAQAEEADRPPWLSEDVVAAAMNIGMSEDQLGPFRASVMTFLADFRDESQRIIRRADAGIETSVLRARSRLAREMDKRMETILSAEQLVPYQDYRAALLDALTPDP